MNICDIANQRVKISAHTVTIKDADGKTRGMIRNIDTISTATTRTLQPIFKAIRTAGIWTDEQLSARTIIAGGKVYLLRNLKYEEDFHKYFEGKGLAADEARHADVMRIYAAAEANGIPVIPCYIV